MVQQVILPITEVRNRFGSLLREDIVRDKTTVVITLNGRGVAVLLDYKEYVRLSTAASRPGKDGE